MGIQKKNRMEVIPEEEQDEPTIDVLIKWNKNNYTVPCYPYDNILDLKLKLEALTCVQVDKQKLMVRFATKPDDVNDALISQIKLPANKTIMMVGTPEDQLFQDLSHEEQERFGITNDLVSDKGSLPDRERPENLRKIELRKASFQPKIFNDPRPGKKLLVLDIDYTLFDHRSSAERPEELMRPFLHEFLTGAYPHYDIIIWSATSYKWIELKMTSLGVMSNPNYKIVCFYDYSAMITVHSAKYGVVNVKPLPVLWHHFSEFYSPENTIMFDDIRRNFLMNPQNGLRIKPFRNAAQARLWDRELEHLLEYLKQISSLGTFRKLKHKNWKHFL